jgi:hypothetical protein
MPEDMTTVYRAADIGEADIVVAFLDRHGIIAHVKDRLAVGTLQVPAIVAPRGIEVCVAPGEAAERAAALLHEHFDELAAARSEDSGGTVEAVCEECGRTASYPSKQRGTVQNCPHCRAHVDVPE